MLKSYLQETSAVIVQRSIQGQEEQWIPPMDILETQSAYLVHLEVPGARKQDLRLGFRDNTLTIWGKRHNDEQDTTISFLQMEIEYGEFHREIHFPHQVSREQTKAHYKNGVLKVVLPKR